MSNHISKVGFPYMKTSSESFECDQCGEVILSTIEGNRIWESLDELIAYTKHTHPKAPITGGDK